MWGLPDGHLSLPFVGVAAWAFTLAKKEHHAVANLEIECGDHQTNTLESAIAATLLLQ
ncbi:hypothetical protein ACD631_01375 [Alteromonas macleodii]|uniref:hypothetical protein n=1 Tax=Alteromonas macleodii TaxID=28108 RepID=UPI002076A810|nr:hypothetical protein [Alteromonas macleodii]USI29025.1 hypothetical protein NFG60_04815 [Alteromonas macleodii]